MIDFLMPYAFIALPLPILMYFLSKKNVSREEALRVPYFQEWMNVQGGVSVSSGQTKNKSRWIYLVAWMLLVTSAARPEWTGDAIELPVSGRDLMLAVDLSGSMENRDFVINGNNVDRLTAVKSVVGEFVERRSGDRIGLILFGRRAYVQTPLTFDVKTVRNMLSESVIGLAGKETAIGDAIGLAVKRLKDRPENSRVLILLTDGANTAGEVAPLQAATLAAEAGLKIYTIGVGADRMEVESFFGSRMVNPSADLDEETLTAIATQTGGKYFRAKNTKGLEEVYAALDALEPIRSDVEIFRPRRQLFFWFLGASLFLFVAPFLVSSMSVAFNRQEGLN